MADRSNIISASIDASRVEEMITGLRALRAELDFLISLDTKQRRGLVYPGTRALTACEDIAQLAEQNPDHFPPAVVDAAELRRDLSLASVLEPLQLEVSALNQALTDTIAAARSDAYRGGLKGYTLAQLVEGQIPGLKAMIARLRQAFDRRAASPASPVDADPPTPTP